MAGGGVEWAFAPNWSMNVEYLLTKYGNSTVLFPNAGLQFTSDLSLQQVRAGLNYRFGGGGTNTNGGSTGLPTPATDIVNFHGQTTFVWQAYPAMRSPYSGSNSLPGSGLGRETFDTTLYAGIRLWQGAEVWLSPEIDQGFGFADTHGVAGFPSGESYKLGSAYPYVRMHRGFLRQTIDLGGEVEKVDADISQFAGSRTANRLVLTIGKFAIVDIFDTNKYANSPKTDFLNWSLINAGTFDYAGDGWGYTYGAAAEWYQGSWTLRAGVFDLSASPAGGISPNGGVLNSTFQQYTVVAEIEKRYELWGQPGKLKVTGFVNRGRAGRFQDAILLSQITGEPADITAVRRYTSRPGIHVNWEQQVSGVVGYSPAPAGPTATSSHGILPTSTARSRAGPPSTAGIGAGRTIPSGSRESSTTLAAFTGHFSTPAAWASSSATDNCPIQGSRRSSRPITATRSHPTRASASTISSSPIPPTIPTAAR